MLHQAGVPVRRSTAHAKLDKKRAQERVPVQHEPCDTFALWREADRRVGLLRGEIKLLKLMQRLHDGRHLDVQETGDIAHLRRATLADDDIDCFEIVLKALRHTHRSLSERTRLFHEVRELDGLDRLLKRKRERRGDAYSVVDMPPIRACSMKRALGQLDLDRLHRNVLV